MAPWRALLLAVVLCALASHVQAQQGGALPALVSPQEPLPPAPPLPLERVRLPPGFAIGLYADSVVPNARFMALGQANDQATVVFVSSTTGQVTALVDRGGGNVTACVLLNSNLQLPNGIAYDRQAGALFIAAVDRITRHEGADAAALAGCDASLLGTSVVTASAAALPPQASHGNRALALGPRDGRLYYTVAAPFNVGACQQGNTTYCAVYSVGQDGSGARVEARGIRNAGGLEFHPATGDLLFAGNERDELGGDRPDDILGAIPLQGPRPDFRFPYCHWEGDGPPEARRPGPGTAISDANMSPGSPSPTGQLTPEQQAAQAADCAATAARPIQALGPHVAPLGILHWPSGRADSGGAAARVSGVRNLAWPGEYDGSVFTGEHGSWNRDAPIGYRVGSTRLLPDGRTAAAHSVFAEGWLDASLARPQPAWHPPAWGRPVGLLRLPDGSMLVADDWAQVVYRIAYNPAATNASSTSPPGSSSGGGGGTSSALSVAAAALVPALLTALLAGAALL